MVMRTNRTKILMKKTNQKLPKRRLVKRELKELLIKKIASSSDAKRERDREN